MIIHKDPKNNIDYIKSTRAENRECARNRKKAISKLNNSTKIFKEIYSKLNDDNKEFILTNYKYLFLDIEKSNSVEYILSKFVKYNILNTKEKVKIKRIVLIDTIFG